MSMSLTDLVAVADKIEKRWADLEKKTANLDSFTSLFDSISSALTDIVEQLENKQDVSTDAIKQLTAAIKGMKGASDVKVEPPKVTVEVPKQEPPNVTVEVSPTPFEINVQPPKQWSKLNITITEYDQMGSIKSMRITRD